METLREVLEHLARERGSDLLVKVGSVPHLRLDGQLRATTLPAPSPEQVENLVDDLLTPEREAELNTAGEVDMAVSLSGTGRFRICVYRQRGSLSLAIRRVLPGAPSVDDLNLPGVVERLASEDHGLVLITGPAASGRTTTVASMLDHINRTRACHVVTFEDPIEILHADKRALLSQREVGADTGRVLDGLRRVGRQNADVLFVGDVRDAEVAAELVAEAAAGRLVIATLSTLSTVDTVNHMIDFFPPHLHDQARASLARVLRGVVTQRLLDRADGRGRTPAVEVLLGTNKVLDAIAEGTEGSELNQLMHDGEYHGMQTFDQALFHLYRENLIGVREALAAAARPEDLRISLQQAGLAATY